MIASTLPSNETKTARMLFNLIVTLGMTAATFDIAMSLDCDLMNNVFLSSEDILLQKEVQACNNIKSSLPYEILAKGPPVVRRLLKVDNSVDNLEISKIIYERSRFCFTGRIQALRVLGMPWYTPNPILRERIQAIDKTIVPWVYMDPRVGSGSSGPNLFLWFPHP